MIEEEENPSEENHENENGDHPEEGLKGVHEENLNGIVPISGMYKEWFLDYASYVILERAVPNIDDGLKPVQRRILHAMKVMDDGRFNKVANIIGQTMQYHPHGDASIGDALVQIGQKNLLIETQGNWGNTLTGDRAAAPRYIEARLSKFALEVVFNSKTTAWQLSYDGRNKEPIHLPAKFPLLLALGAEGIAVGLACKILPHNFNEIIDASVAYLKGRTTKIYPDFQNGGTADFSQYNDGKRGGKVRVRAKIKQLDKTTLCIHEIPHATTTSSLIESIVKASEKGSIKIKKIEDNTAAQAEIIIHLPPGVSPDKTIDALYAFTSCEIPISPNTCVIRNDRPAFLSVTELLQDSVDQTKALLNKELEIRKAELEEQWHSASLERIFIENRIYRKIENESTWEGVITAINNGLKPFLGMLNRPVTEEDVVRLTEIRIKRISKFDITKAIENIKKIEEQLKEVKKFLRQLTEYAIDYYKTLKKKYGKDYPRQTEIKVFDNIEATKVIVANKKLYVNRNEGFAGYSLKKDEFIGECSDLDDIIVFRKDGTMLVTRIDAKKFVGKNIEYIEVWKKGDKRTIYHMIYQDGPAGPAFVKRFAVDGITRDKEYNLTKGTKGSRILFFSANPNGEAEVVTIRFRPRPKLKKLKMDFDFTELAIKGRGVKGNLLTKNLVSKVESKERGESTLAARKIWYDDVVHRLNVDGRGKLLGNFSGEDRILAISSEGYYKLVPGDLALRFEENLLLVEKWNDQSPVSLIYFDGEKGYNMVKRFLPKKSNGKVWLITDHEDSVVILVTSQKHPVVNIDYDRRGNGKQNETLSIDEFIAVKGVSALGKRLGTAKVKNVQLLTRDDDDFIESAPIAPEIKSKLVKQISKVKTLLKHKKSPVIELSPKISKTPAVALKEVVKKGEVKGRKKKKSDAQISLFE